MSLDTIGLVFLIENDLQQAGQYARQALMIHEQVEDLSSQGYDHNHLGLVLLAAGQPEEAARQHAEALRLRRGIGQGGLAMDDLAGLARAALAQRDGKQAAAYAREILAGIDELGPDGLEFPVWVYLTCFRALETDEPERARQVLADGYAYLRKSADSIQDESRRNSFLENVPWNRELLNEYYSLRQLLC